MNTQSEALRLADQLRDVSSEFKTPSHERGVCNGAIEELRRLHEENTSLNRCLFQMQEAAKNLEQQLGEAVWNHGEKVRANQELVEALKAIRNSSYMPHALIGLIDREIAKATGEQA